MRQTRQLTDPIKRAKEDDANWRVLTLAEIEQLDWAPTTGFRAPERVQFDASPADRVRPIETVAEMIAAEAKARTFVFLPSPRFIVIPSILGNPKRREPRFNGRSMSLHTLVSKRWLDFQVPSSKPSSMNAVGISFTNRSRIICRG